MEYFSALELINQHPPKYRAAYSDRMAWLMAELSHLAYVKFETLPTAFDHWAEQLNQLNTSSEIKEYLKQTVAPEIKSTEGSIILNSHLATAGFSLVSTFDVDGTQAFIAENKADKVVVLIFRGTEATERADILTNINCLLKNESGAKVHNGFLTAYNKISSEVEIVLKEFNDYALYTTGHSLGGALAIIAAWKLNKDNLAACYTFGSPRVGNEELGCQLKTPIYRVINTADIVPRLPSSWLMEISIDLSKILSTILPFFGKLATILDDKISCYRHYGDMRYLTACKKEDLSDVKVIKNITFMARLRRLIKNQRLFKTQIKDHYIERYCKKLAAYALKRNTPITPSQQTRKSTL